jgi:hypothetical protein
MRTIASTPGCYKYEPSAFDSGAVYGMSGVSRPELVILPRREETVSTPR